MIQGATLDAEFCDAQNANGRVSTACQIAAYVCMSRVRELSKICVLQAFSLLLFTSGPPKGPDRLLRKLSGQVTSDAALEEWISEDSVKVDEKKSEATDPMKQRYLCTSCYLAGEEDYSHPVQKFGVVTSSEFYSKYVAQGCWSRCLQCQRVYGETVSTRSAVVKTTLRDEKINMEVCKTCGESFFEHVLDCGSHGCSACRIFSQRDNGATPL